jgi:hypothetical protein
MPEAYKIWLIVLLWCADFWLAVIRFAQWLLG